SDNFVALSSTIAEHEVGHTAGLEHADSFGPIGFGDHIVQSLHYLPAFPGPSGAWETPEHIMASPASVASTLADAAGNTFFAEREDVKLAFIEGGTVVSENTSSPHDSIANAQQANLVALSVPNTVLQGFNAGKVFSVSAIDVVGSIQLDGTGHSQSDFY